MKQKADLRIIASIIIALVISIPIYPSYVFAEEESIPYDVSYIMEIDVPESPDVCIAKHEKTDDLIEMFDNEIISTLTNIIAFAQAICSIKSTIQTMLSAITTVLGHPLSTCCLVEGFPPLALLCGKTITEKYVVELSFMPLDVVCCIASCGMYKKGNGELVPCGIGIFGAPLAVYTSALSTAGVNPETSISAAAVSLCVPAILTHVKRLKLIYQTYNCCVKEACNNGMSTETCERQLDFQTCVFWEGGVVKTLIYVLIALIAGLIASIFGADLADITGVLTPLISCIISWWDVVNLPLSLTALLDRLQNLNKAFDEPECKDLGFDTYAEYIPEPVPIYYRLEDTDGDGRYDLKEEIEFPGIASEYNAITGEVVGGRITGMVTDDLVEQALELYDEGQFELAKTVLGVQGVSDEQFEKAWIKMGYKLPDPTQKTENLYPTQEPPELLKIIPSSESEEEVEEQEELLQRQTEEPPSLLERFAGLLGLGKEKPAEEEEEQKIVPSSKPDQTPKKHWQSEISQIDKDLTGLKNLLSMQSDAPSESRSVIETKIESLKEQKAEIQSALKGTAETPPKDVMSKADIKASQMKLEKLIKGLMTRFLGPIIDEKINEMCQSKLDSSEPESQTPSSQTVGPTEFTEDYCYKNPSKTTVTCQASKSDDIYTFSYSAVSCKQDLNMQVKLENTGFRILDSIFLSKGTVLHKSGSVNDTHGFDNICVYTNDDDVGTDGVLCSAITGTG